MPDPVPGLLEAGDRARLASVLEESRRLGFLGPGPIGEQIERSLALAPVLEAAIAVRMGGDDAVRAMDLGSGGGLPGLVLAVATPAWEWTLLDGSVKRTDALTSWVQSLGLADRVRVIAARAEDAGRTGLRGQFGVVVARGFAAAAPTAECGAPFLGPGGALVVTEPPGGAPSRWPDGGLRQLGLERGDAVVAPVAAQVLRAVVTCPDRFPRRTGVPVKRPLWSEDLSGS